MKTFTERMLEKIAKVSQAKGYFFACDIYYNDLGESRGQQFVVKLTGLNNKQTRHFRTNHIRKSLQRALAYVQGLS